MSKEIKPWIEIRNVTAQSADVYLYEKIGMTDAVAGALAELRSLTSKTVNVRINSPGGSVFGGFAVYNALESLNAKIVVHIDGIAASIASVIAMAGDEIVIAENAVIMIHAPTGAAEGTAEDLRATAGAIERNHASMAEIYRKRSGQTADQVAELMSTDSWLTADEAVARGFATSIAASMAIAASFDLSAFKNVPEKLMSKPTESAAPAATEAAAKTAAETFTAEAVAAKVQAAERIATEAAHAAAKTQLDQVKADAVLSINSIRSELTGKITAQAAEIETLKTKLKEAEAMSAANIGAASVSHVVTSAANNTAGKTPGTPAEMLAHYRALKGAERDVYFRANKNAIWDAHEAEMRTAR